METKILNGLDADVYRYIAPFAMNQKILREFDGYSIVTGEDYVWFLVFKDRQLVAWASLRTQKNKIKFIYAYVIPEFRKQGIHKELIFKRIDWCENNGYKIIEVDCLKTSLNNYKKIGFKEVKTFSKWHKLEFEIIQPEELGI